MAVNIIRKNNKVYKAKLAFLLVRGLVIEVSLKKVSEFTEISFRDLFE